MEEKTAKAKPDSQPKLGKNVVKAVKVPVQSCFERPVNRHIACAILGAGGGREF